MISRILVAGLLGAAAMFVWSGIAHMATPLATTGFQPMPNEAAVLSTLHTAVGDKPGFFLFPWTDPSAMTSKAGRAAYTAKLAVNPSGLLLYRGPGLDPGMTTGMLVQEFLKQLVVCLLAAFLLAQARLPSFWARVGFVAAIGAVAALETNASYRIWYMFPADFTLAAIVMSFVGYLFAGAAIAWWLKPAPLQPAG